MPLNRYFFKASPKAANTADTEGTPRVLFSYGTYSIYMDLKNGVPKAEVARRITERYPDITPERAKKMVEQISKDGMNAKVDWSKEKGLGDHTKGTRLGTPEFQQMLRQVKDRVAGACLGMQKLAGLCDDKAVSQQCLSHGKDIEAVFDFLQIMEQEERRGNI